MTFKTIIRSDFLNLFRCRAMFVSHQVLISERIIEPAVPNKIRKLLLRCSTCQDFQKM
jgi:hypothetical protein